jgi:hypothetical protein
MTDIVDFSYAQSILVYNPMSGELTWKTRSDVGLWWNDRYAGKVAGSINQNGYRQILINKKSYRSHRLAWLLFYGEWPSLCIDHIDRNKINNRINNLRLATRAENGRNSDIQKNNTTGATGVYWRGKRRKFEAQIRNNGKIKSLGYFNNIEDAKKARERAEVDLFGSFRRAA